MHSFQFPKLDVRKTEKVKIMSIDPRYSSKGTFYGPKHLLIERKCFPFVWLVSRKSIHPADYHDIPVR